MGNQHDYLPISYPQAMDPTHEHLQAEGLLEGENQGPPKLAAVGVREFKNSSSSRLVLAGVKAPAWGEALLGHSSQIPG